MGSMGRKGRNRAAAFEDARVQHGEMPTSAAWSDGASLIPSPMNPTTWSRAFRARMMRFFWAGETRAKTTVRSATTASAPSVMPSSSAPLDREHVLRAARPLHRGARSHVRRRPRAASPRAGAQLERVLRPQPAARHHRNLIGGALLVGGVYWFVYLRVRPS